MTVKDITKEYLIAHGYKGLYNSNGECGCGIDDLSPCCGTYETLNDCEPAYHNTCNNCTNMPRCGYKVETGTTECYWPNDFRIGA